MSPKRASYGEEIILTLSNNWIAEFGNGFPAEPRADDALRETFTDQQVVASLSRHLSWSN